MLPEEELIFLDSHIICPRLDVFPSIQERLERGMVVGFQCEPTKENALLFKQLYESHTKASMSIRTSEANKTRVIYKATLRCHHNVPFDAKRPRTTSKRDTGCPWGMVLLVKTPPIGPRKKSPVAFCGLVVSGHGSHNHNVNMPASLIHRRVPAKTDQRLMELFRQHHSPATALQMLDMDLQLDAGESYHLEACDRAQLPDLGYVYRLYDKVFKQQYGDQSEALGDRLRQLASDREDTRVDVTDGDMIVSIVSPLMERAHQLQEAGEQVFVDAGGNVDRSQARVFQFMVKTVCGGVPLGVVITNCEAQSTLEKGFALLRDMLPAGAFGGRGLEGPVCFMTDDSASERNALAASWPSARRLLCIFHVLQAAWRWLFSATNKIDKSHRQELMRYMKQLVYASNESEMGEIARTQEEVWGEQYPNFTAYVGSILSRRSEWALCLRNDVPTRGNNTNNIVEAAVRVLKDSVLHRTRAFDVIQLHDMVATRLSSFYERKLVAFASGRRPAIRRERQTEDVPQDNIRRSEGNQNVFEVTSKDGKSVYFVDPSIGACSCPSNVKSGYCKHLNAVNRLCGSTVTPGAAAATVEERKQIMFVANGQEDLPEVWFQGLANSTDCQDSVPESDVSPAEASILDPGPSTSIQRTTTPIFPTQPTDDSDDDFTDPASFSNTHTTTAPPHMSPPQATQAQHVDSVNNFLETLRNSIVHDMHTHPDQVPAWEKAMNAFLSDWNGASPSAQRAQLHRSRLPRNATSIPVNNPQRRTACPLRGRRRTNAGRPAKASRKDHQYVKEGGRKKAGHGLHLCEAENIALGR